MRSPIISNSMVTAARNLLRIQAFGDLLFPKPKSKQNAFLPPEQCFRSGTEQDSNLASLKQEILMFRPRPALFKWRRNPILCRFFCALAAIFIAGCSANPDVAGVSETTNGIVLITGPAVSAETGSPLAGAELYIRPENFIADSSNEGSVRIPDATADKAGNFVLDSITTGNWVIEINLHDSLVETVHCTVENADQKLGSISVRPAANLTGTVDRSGLSANEQVFVQIRGVDRIYRVDLTGTFRLSGIPAGSQIFRLFSSRTVSGVIGADTITVVPREQNSVGHFRLPVDSWRDTVVVRQILDINGLTALPVDSVVGSYTVDHRIAELNLANRGITTLTDAITTLRIHQLRLSNNAIDSLPEEIGSMRSLRGISINGNKVTALPQSIVNLTDLVRLDCAGNELSALPVGIENLSSISFLNMNENRLNSLSTSIESWIDQYSTDPNWKMTQK